MEVIQTVVAKETLSCVREGTKKISHVIKQQWKKGTHTKNKQFENRQTKFQMLICPKHS